MRVVKMLCRTKLSFSVFIFGAGCASDPFLHSDAEICSALLELAAHSKSESVEVEAVLIKDSGEIACGYSPPSAIERYCRVVLDNTLMEFVNGYPWAVKECVAKHGRVAITLSTNDWSGLAGGRRKKIVEVGGALKSGTAVKLVFEPDDENNTDNYYGRYRLTLAPEQARTSDDGL